RGRRRGQEAIRAAASRCLWRAAPEKSMPDPGGVKMAYWLMKSEPHSYSWDQLVRDGGTEWDGVRNPAARLHLKAMKPGDEALFYHSGEEKAAVGIMRIT